MKYKTEKASNQVVPMTTVSVEESESTKWEEKKFLSETLQLWGRMGSQVGRKVNKFNMSQPQDWEHLMEWRERGGKNSFYLNARLGTLNGTEGGKKFLLSE